VVTVFCFGLIAGALSVVGVAEASPRSSWLLRLSGILLLMVHLLAGPTGRVF
jgi:uncharacterized membrane protein YtjA (UPF0391 family)